MPNKKIVSVWFALGMIALMLLACASEAVPLTNVASTVVPSVTSSPVPTETHTLTPTPTVTPTWTPVARTFFPQPTMDIDVTLFVELRRYGNGDISSMQLQPGGKILAQAGGVGIWLYDSQSLELISHLDGDAGWVNQIDWSPDGRYLAAANDNGTVQVWDVIEGEIIQIFDKHRDAVLAVDWAPDGERLVSGGKDNIARVWELSSGNELQSAKGSESECGPCSIVDSLAWSPGGETIALITDRVVLIWKLNQDEEFVILDSWSISALEWSPDGKYLAVSTDVGIRIFKTKMCSDLRNRLRKSLN